MHLIPLVSAVPVLDLNKHTRIQCEMGLTLYEPRFFTEHASFTLRPAGTVMFSMTSVNSGSSRTAEMGKKEAKHTRCVRKYTNI